MGFVLTCADVKEVVALALPPAACTVKRCLHTRTAQQEIRVGLPALFVAGNFRDASRLLACHDAQEAAMADLAQRPVTLAAEQWGALGSRLTALESSIQVCTAGPDTSVSLTMSV